MPHLQSAFSVVNNVTEKAVYLYFKVGSSEGELCKDNVFELEPSKHNNSWDVGRKLIWSIGFTFQEFCQFVLMI